MPELDPNENGEVVDAAAAGWPTENTEEAVVAGVEPVVLPIPNPCGF